MRLSSPDYAAFAFARVLPSITPRMSDSLRMSRSSPSISPLAEQHAVADFDIQWNEPACLVARAGAHCQHLAFDRLLLRRVGDDDPGRGPFLGLDASDQNAIVQRPEAAHAAPSFRVHTLGW
jgi:hypothetical protein